MNRVRDKTETMSAVDRLERHLRMAGQPVESRDDPLAELARLVGQQDPFRDLFHRHGERQTKDLESHHGVGGRDSPHSPYEEELTEQYWGSHDPHLEEESEEIPRYYSEESYSETERGIMPPFGREIGRKNFNKREEVLSLEGEPYRHPRDLSIPYEDSYGERSTREAGSLRSRDSREFLDRREEKTSGKRNYGNYSKGRLLRGSSEEDAYLSSSDLLPSAAFRLGGRSHRRLYAMGAALAVVIIGLGAIFYLRSLEFVKKHGIPPTITASQTPMKIPSSEGTAEDGEPQSAHFLDNQEKDSQRTTLQNNQESPTASPTELRKAELAAGFVNRLLAHAGFLFFSSAPLSHGLEHSGIDQEIAAHPTYSYISPDAPPLRVQPVQTFVFPVESPPPGAPAAQEAVPPSPPAVPSEPSGAAEEGQVPIPAPRKGQASPQAGQNVGEAAGAIAVQLAATRREEEARQFVTYLQQKFAAELKGAVPSIYRVDEKPPIFRVRVLGLSPAAAKDMCERFKARGRACFITRADP